MTRKEKQAHIDRMNTIREAAQKIVSTGKCPDCGARLRRNSSMAGWWQCGRYGQDSFREAEYRGQKDCSFQCFTE